MGDREVAVARELTKLHEEVLRGRASELTAALAARPPLKGEITLVVAAPGKTITAPQEDIDRALLEALANLPTGRAAAEVARHFNLPRNDVYRRALTLKGTAEEGGSDAAG
jgi:16S rRNA (cytidine1402-2'-O)-methyltransferase